LRQQLDALSSAFDQHVTMTEGTDGLLEDIVVAAPRLAHRADATRKDHSRLRSQLDAVLASLPADDSRVAQLRDQVVELLTGLVRHRQAGADLVYEAYNVDIEAAD
jgi:ABC-type transporter Mla subunit MlaD